MRKEEFLKKYLVNRKGTDCQKWDDMQRKFGDPNLLAMWVADMEFKTCDSISEALMKRVQHGVFGYSMVPKDYMKVFSGWMERRYNFPVKREWLRFGPGCVPTIAWAINAYTKPGDACMILTPVYYPFHNVVTDNNRKLVKVDLNYNDGYFTMNYDEIEKAIVDNDVKLFLQCSPHNPAGRVWSEEELDNVLKICQKHALLVVSDEIHQDFVMGRRKFVPAAVVGGGKYRDILITFNAASKTFNLASLNYSHVIITNETLMKKYDQCVAGISRMQASLMGQIATKAGYEGGEEWLEALKGVICDNYDYVKTTFARELPKIVLCSMEGTYLPLLDLREYVKPENTHEFVQERCRLGVDYGEWFGDKFKGFIRLNLATDPELVHQAVTKIIEEIKQI